MVERVAGGPYLQFRDKAVMNAPLAFEDELFGRSVTLMSENVSVVACLNKQGWVSRSLVSVDTSDVVVNRVAGREASGQVHSGEMECRHRSARLVQTDCTYRVVPPSEGPQ